MWMAAAILGVMDAVEGGHVAAVPLPEHCHVAFVLPGQRLHVPPVDAFMADVEKN